MRSEDGVNEVDPRAPRSDEAGLSSDEARRRLAEDGPNEIARAEATSPVAVFFSQFRSPIIWLLLVACGIAAVLGEAPDAIAIGIIVLVNALVGFFQEVRAERAVLALRSLTAPRARVVRDGRSEILPASEIVVGDVVILEAGDVVPADAHVEDAQALSTGEASLTGESVPVEKSTAPVADDAPLAERSDTVFMGTSVVTGTGRARVVATGMRTELGKIAHLLSTAESTETPLSKQLEGVSRLLVVVCLAVVAVVAGLGVLHGAKPFDVFLSSVSLAVAAVPEGLPAIVTIALALGVQRIAAKNVLVRKLPSVETLGCATVICTDKTGTLTTGVMTVREIWGPDELEILRAAASCCDAELSPDEKSGVGDPTEVALLVAAAERGIYRGDIERSSGRVSVRPFDADRRRASIERSDGTLYLKGAVEVVLERCSSIVHGAAEANAAMAERGLRVLAVAVGRGSVEDDLRLLGLVGIADPPRPEAIAAVAAAHAAGIETVMITGDHPTTARAIARELGIVRDGVAIDDVVHARATPQDKLDVIRAWKAKGAVVAMTGDGVNDAPALREADIGIAMGKTGTEVTREASDMILTDDHFASIVEAIREGRGIFDNIQKTLAYLLAGNASELFAMLFAAIVGMPLPLLPLHLLWLNLVTETLPALALVTDPTEGDVLARPPRKAKAPMLGAREWSSILAMAVLQAAVMLGVFRWGLRDRSVDEARTLAFTALVLGDLFRAFAARSHTRTFFEVGAFTNLRLLGIVLASAATQYAILYFPVTQRLFRLHAPGLRDGLSCLAAGLVTVTVLEVRKLVVRAFTRAEGKRT
jgi:Ca2+-transporting ATPase